MSEQNSQKKKEYNKMVEEVSPKPNTIKNCFFAFLVGGIICVIGQIITDILLKFNISIDEAKILTSVILIFIGAFLTGIDVYDAIGQFAGAGTIIPITGFSNSIVASAMEYKKEGYVMGVGAKMFTIAGPVIVYGVISSVIVGLLYYFINL